MSRNVCIFSDGTGQAGRADRKDNTNVWRLYRACCDAPPDETGEPPQVCFYDAGLGSPDDHVDAVYSGGWFYRLLSKATGLGITANIKECYDALIRLYRPGARIFLFGFSRGAYTVRSLGGVISLCGVPMRDAEGRDLTTDDAARKAVVEEAVEKVYKIYADDEADRERARKARLDAAAAFRARHTVDDVAPYFIGVWDTVRALGLPGSATLFRFRHAFHDHTLSAKVPFARQALAVDERRVVFEPVPWDAEPDAPAQEPARILQTWFAGAHSDIGGGYPASALSDVALDWMIREATSLPAPLIVGPVDPLPAPDPDGQHHDETLANWFWRRGARAVRIDIPVAETTCRRIGRPVIHHRGDPRPYRPDNLRTHPQTRYLF